MCHGQKSRFFVEFNHPTFNDGILISWGPINPYGIGLMSSHPYHRKINKALLRDHWPLVSLNKALLGPYFLGGVALGGYIP